MKKNGKKTLTILLVLTILATCMIPVSAFAATRDTSKQEAIAKELNTLHMFEGVAPGNYDLNRAPSRLEGVVMVIRMLGKESKAANTKWANPFLDLPSWAENYIGYAWQNSIVDGISQTRFGTSDCTLQMYLTFTLRALGYDDINAGDFTWNAPEALAKSVGILTDDVNTTDFWRADVVTICANALNAKLKGTTTTLADKLIREGVFSRTAYEKTAMGGYKAGKATEPEATKEGFYAEYQWLPDLGKYMNLTVTEKKKYSDGYQYRYDYTGKFTRDQLLDKLMSYYNSLTGYGITPTNSIYGTQYSAFYVDYVITLTIRPDELVVDVQNIYES